MTFKRGCCQLMCGRPGLSKLQNINAAKTPCYLRLAPGPTHRVEFADEDHVGGGRRVGLGQVSDHLEHHGAVVCLCREMRSEGG